MVSSSLTLTDAYHITHVPKDTAQALPVKIMGLKWYPFNKHGIVGLHQQLSLPGQQGPEICVGTTPMLVNF
jgi:hypothetical protein